MLYLAYSMKVTAAGQLQAEGNWCFPPFPTFRRILVVLRVKWWNSTQHTLPRHRSEEMKI